MASPNFFNENEGRTFPFLANFQEAGEISNSSSQILDMLRLPNSAVVDFGAVMGVMSFYEADTHTVYLYQISRDNSLLHFDFRCTAPGLENYRLVFVRSIASEDYETEYVDAIQLDDSFSSSVSECVDAPIWTGYMVSGSMRELVLLLTDDGMVLRGDHTEAVVEPALMQSLVGSYARSLNLANADRTRAENADDCIPLVRPFDVAELYINRVCMSGVILFKEGYNTIIDQNDLDNTITISAGIGAGQGEPCEEVSLFVEEVPANGEELLSGGPKCNDVIRSINGAGGRILDIMAGPGATVTPDPDRNRVIIDLDMRGLAVCFEGEELEESCSEEVSNSLCGPLET